MEVVPLIPKPNGQGEASGPCVVVVCLLLRDAGRKSSGLGFWAVAFLEHGKKLISAAARLCKDEVA